MSLSAASRIDRAGFGAMPDGTAVERLTLRGDPEHGRTFIMEVAARGRAEPDVRLSSD